MTPEHGMGSEVESAELEQHAIDHEGGAIDDVLIDTDSVSFMLSFTPIGAIAGGAIGSFLASLVYAVVTDVDGSSRSPQLFTLFGIFVAAVTVFAIGINPTLRRVALRCASVAFLAVALAGTVCAARCDLSDDVSRTAVVFASVFLAVICLTVATALWKYAPRYGENAASFARNVAALVGEVDPPHVTALNRRLEDIESRLEGVTAPIAPTREVSWSKWWSDRPSKKRRG